MDVSTRTNDETMDVKRRTRRGLARRRDVSTTRRRDRDETSSKVVGTST
jgi:hypothetical protein